jgi:hypothetical protein
MGPILRPSVKGRELEEGLLDGAIVVDMDGVLEHVVDEVGVGFDEVVKGLEDLEVLSLLLVEKVEPYLVLV